MLAKFIKILITPQANPKHCEEQKKDLKKKERDIFHHLVSVYRNFILLVEVVSNFIPAISYFIVLIFVRYIFSITLNKKNKTQILNDYK